MHIFVSPHLDDAVMSCGATIARLTAAGEPVRVVTVFAGEPTTLSPLAKAMHKMWALSAVQDRRAEDIEACTSLGADYEHLEYQDALYRMDGAGKPHYGRLRQLNGAIAEADGPVLASVTAALLVLFGQSPGARVYGPAALGDHVDHMLTRQAVVRACDRLTLYEDLPYACRLPGPAERQPGRVLMSRCSARDWARKIHAIELYTTQLELLWPERNWVRELSDYAARIGSGSDAYVERAWMVGAAPMPA